MKSKGAQAGKKAGRQASTRKAFSRSHALEGLVEKFVDDWRGTNDKTHLLGTNVLIDASMLGSALKITSLGWKTSTCPNFPTKGALELCSLFSSGLTTHYQCNVWLNMMSLCASSYIPPIRKTWSKSENIRGATTGGVAKLEDHLQK